MSKINVLIVDDHPITRYGIAQAIHNRIDMVTCGEAGTLIEAKHSIKTCNPDIVLVDISLEQETGFDLIEEIRKSKPDILWMIISMHDDILYLQRAFRSGVSGYIHKSEDPSSYPNAILKVQQGELYWSKHLTPQIQILLSSKSKSNNAIGSLTDRENEILLLLSLEKSRKEIAEVLHRSIKTINSHIENIKKKLGVSSHKELLQYSKTKRTPQID